MTLARLALYALAALPAGVLCGPSRVNTYSRRANDSLPIYKDASRCVDERVEDLVSLMTLEEKAGQMFQRSITMGVNGTLVVGTNDTTGTEELLGDKLMTHFNLGSDITSPREVAEWVNRVQERAMANRLGIPVTLSTDPRHAFTENIGTGFRAGIFSQWPETLGMAALRDPDLVRQFATIAREEYLAVGIRAALHPQMDLSTEPRWARIAGTWGESADLTAELIVPYIKGFQGDKIGRYSVSTVTKHFPGGGAAQNGEDSHFTYGKNETFPGRNQEYHLKPFRAAIAAGARQIMPYYSRPVGTEWEEVGYSFNKGVITDLLQTELGFEGIVVTDWGLITDAVILGQDMPARAWGVESLTELQRLTKILEAGCDQFGGEERPELLVQAVQEGLVSEERIDHSIRKLMREKFMLGLFDYPYVDVDAAQRVVGNDYFVRVGADAQRRSYTLLTNQDNILPLTSVSSSTAFYVEGMDPEFVTTRGYQVVATPEAADYALIRVNAPYEPRPGGFEAHMHAGSLEFNSTEKARQAAIFAAAPTIVDMVLDRPAAVPEVAEQAAAFLGSYGSDSNAFLDVVFGVGQPEGKLPFDLPRSDAAVEAQLEDVPFDTRDPVFKFGHGLSYTNKCAATGGVC